MMYNKTSDNEMTDHGETLRQKFISDYTILEAKRADLRAHMHAEGKYFIGEEALAKRNNGKVFHALKGWQTTINDDHPSKETKMSQTPITHAELSNNLASMSFDQLKKLLEDLVTENYTVSSKALSPRIVLVRPLKENKND